MPPTYSTISGVWIFRRLRMHECVNACPTSSFQSAPARADRRAIMHDLRQKKDSSIESNRVGGK